MLTPILLVRPTLAVLGNADHLPDGRGLLVLRRAEAEVVEDAPEGEGVGHERNDAHALAAAGADQRIHFVDLRDQPRPAGRTPLGRRVCHMSEQVAGRDPRSVRARRELAVCRDKVGDALSALGEPAKALSHYRSALALREALVAADRRDAELRRDLSVSHDKIGRVLLARGDATGALASFREALALDETAARADPASAQARLDVSADLENVGSALIQAGRLTEAATALEGALDLRERVSSEDPANAEVRAGFVPLFASLSLLEARRAAASRARRPRPVASAPTSGTTRPSGWSSRESS